MLRETIDVWQNYLWTFTSVRQETTNGIFYDLSDIIGFARLDTIHA